MKILDKYIIKELLSPLLFGITTFTVLFIAGGQLFVVTKMIAEDNASFNTAMTYMINTLPAILVFTFPMAVLLAALLSFGRLSGESELVALKAGGISFPRIAAPAFLLTFFIALFALYLNNEVSPNSTFIAQNILIDQLTKNDEKIRENMVIKDTQEDMDRVIFSKRLLALENRMEHVTIQYFKEGRRLREVYAENVHYDPQKNKWFLKVARIYDYDETQETRYDSVSQEVYLPLDKKPLDFINDRERRPEEMNMAMLKNKLDEMKAKGFSDEYEIKRYNEYMVSYHQKISVPFTCFVFGLFGVPLGIRPQRTSKAIGLGVSIVFIFVYYVFMTIGMAFGRNGYLDPFWAAWLPNILFALAGIILTVRVSRQ